MAVALSLLPCPPVRRTENCGWSRADWKFAGSSLAVVIAALEVSFFSAIDFYDMLCMLACLRGRPSIDRRPGWRAPTCAVKAGSRVWLRLPARPGAAAGQLEMVLWGDWGFR